MTPAKAKILIVDKTATQAGLFKSYLESKGYDVRCAYSGRDALDILSRDPVDLVAIDQHVPDGPVTDILARIGLLSWQGPVVVMADQPDNASATDSLRQVRDRASLLLRPLSVSQLHQAISGLLDHIPGFLPATTTVPASLTGNPDGMKIAAPIVVLQSKPESKPSAFAGFIGTSPVMLALYEQIQNAARSQATVFVTGESGTGKEVCAQAVHRFSARAEAPFVPLNCAAIPRDLLESELFGHVRGAFTGAVSDRDGAAKLADGGTLFLDEIGDMDPHMQTKLLRFLQDGTYQRVGAGQLEHANVRIICATNRDPFADVRAGRFREDLFYRLHVIPVVMPPLRARGDDVIDIAQTLLLRYAAEEHKRFKGFAADAEDLLRRYDWPGNIRQLQNVIRHAVVMHDGIAVTSRMLHTRDGTLFQATPQDNHNSQGAGYGSRSPLRLGDLDGAHPREASSVLPLSEVEKQAIEHAIRLCGGNIPRAAALLQISPSTIYRKKVSWGDTDVTDPDAPENRPETQQIRAGEQ
jgi:two-component system repressor protein LuxO